MKTNKVLFSAALLLLVFAHCTDVAAAQTTLMLETFKDDQCEHPTGPTQAIALDSCFVEEPYHCKVVQKSPTSNIFIKEMFKVASCSGLAEEKIQLTCDVSCHPATKHQAAYVCSNSDAVSQRPHTGSDVITVE
mmetsp:Transcript_11515/g.13650  ORF Transcript_11515/g.13650 Transcript_11515/m.13650 type:complete len:134 (-) Transcript_11515:322-723(-)